MTALPVEAILAQYEVLQGLARGRPLAGNESVVRTIRDLTLLDLLPGLHLVIACDSNGGIGAKPADVVKVSNHMLGRAAARVSLMEVIASGAIPLIMIDTLAVEMMPSGAEIIAGIRHEMQQAGLSANTIMLNGSTEDNIPTVQTGLGTVVIGLATTETLRCGSARAGDRVICVGIPKSGPRYEVRFDDDPEIVDIPAVQRLLAIDAVHDLVPVGSHGVLYEAQALAETTNRQFHPVERGNSGQPVLDLTASGGPATCVVAALDPDDAALSTVRAAVAQPITSIGWLV